MIDLTRPTNFKRTKANLEEFWLVAICVAGKNGPIQAKKVHLLLKDVKGKTPFDKINALEKSGDLLKCLQDVKMGQYKRIEKAFTQSLGLDLKKCSLEDLKKIKGVGNKTSRFFLLHSRRSLDYVVLDTHILRFLRNECGLKNVPKATPTSDKQYESIEKEAKREILVRFPHDSMADADLKIWLMGRSKKFK